MVIDNSKYEALQLEQKYTTDQAKTNQFKRESRTWMLHWYSPVTIIFTTIFMGIRDLFSKRKS